ncbi:MAG: C40 family peptidase, partial [Clostridia bacterium]|nr:C40 family peptidase [Clostridia bacterium]
FPREDEEYTDEAKAVIAAAWAYYDHKQYVQYDQLNMNRVTKKDPRFEFVTPETASEQRLVYMECGVYTRNVYKNVFGYTTPKAGDVLAASYPNTKGERVFYWVGKENQTEEYALQGYRDMLETLQPGDIIYYNYVKNNHVMLYIGGGYILHCSFASGGGDYQYSSMTDKTEPTGALFHAELIPYLAKKDLFASTNKVCLLRPAMLGLEMSEDARIRAEKLQDIVIYKTSSVYLGTSVNPGDEVTVTVKLQNKRTEAAELEVSEILPEGFEYVSGCFDLSSGLTTKVQLAAGEEIELSYTLRVKADVKPGTNLACDGTRVEGMYLSDQPVYVANTLTQAEQQALTALGRVEAGTYAQLISGFYPDRDMSQSSWEPGEILSKMFTGYGLGKNKSTVTLSSLQTSREGLCLVPGMYGGQNCTSPSDNAHNIRVRRITTSNLMVGDLIVYSTDGKKENAQMVIYVGNGLGYMVQNGAETSVNVSPICESLLGQYCFCILRPSVRF